MLYALTKGNMGLANEVLKMSVERAYEWFEMIRLDNEELERQQRELEKKYG